jgi:hypothetical protein
MPSKTRELLTPGFSFMLISWYLPTQSRYYEFIQNTRQVWITCSAYILAMLLILALITILNCRKRLKYRMEFTYVDQCNWWRWIFWGVEVLYTPLLINATWTGNCSFYTSRPALQVTDCGLSSSEPAQKYTAWGLKAGAVFAIIVACLYNLVLFFIIQEEKISNRFHELAVQKKEVEYAIGINKVWNTGKFFTFSSFNSGVLHMYHRIAFNMLPVIIVIGNMILYKD